MGIGAATSQKKELFEDYDGFVEKFKPKRTTDDCYTPPEIYDVVADYVSSRFGVERADMVRPFYPGGNFEAYDYPPGCCVVDNPPFSILARIKEFYCSRGIRFFLFAPTLTLFSGAKTFGRLHHIVVDAKITYENGATIPTSFVTNMEPEIAAETAPEFSKLINEANDARLKAMKKHVPVYEYPYELLTAARMQYMCRHDTRLVVRHSDCARVSKLDANPKGIYGGGVASL